MARETGVSAEGLRNWVKQDAVDCGYQGVGRTVRTPVKRPKGKGNNGWEKQANSALAQLRAPVERAFAVLKRWRVLDTVRISPNRITPLIHALLVVIRKRSSLGRM
ncbi:transposase family protein [Streptomyces sp. NPDC006992]|uniref:transposase family protein n=1 Tax=Streptomyces sp. NPDC006992 TaxID=3155601 RepID=UPI0033D06936